MSDLLMPTLEMERLALERMSDLVERRVGKEAVIGVRISASIDPTMGLAMLLMAQALTIASHVQKWSEGEAAFVISVCLPSAQQDVPIPRLDEQRSQKLLTGVVSAWVRIKNGLRRHCERHISEVC